MNVLILGSGGREHALAWKIKQSLILDNLFVAPGNAGTTQVAENIKIDISDFDAIASFCLEKNINMLVVGPEAPLVDGLVDYFQSRKELVNIHVIGPDKNGAQLEGSKDFAKQFMKKANIPTADYATFSKSEKNEALVYLDKIKAPYVLKADGLAAGKGVIITSNLEEAKSEIVELFDGKFGNAGSKVVIEEFLEGIELSVFVLTDGKDYLLLPEAKDYKQIGEGNTGLNTGGMGAISPVPFANSEFMDKVENRIVKPTISQIQKEKMNYKGFIFIGLMNVNGDPYVIEYNVRMGDPETEVVIPRIKNDVLPIFKSLATQTLSNYKLETDKRYATTVMLVSDGYPEKYEKNKKIDLAEDKENQVVFHAGTKIDENDVVTNGGRVISITSLSDNMQEALNASFKTAETISFEGKYYRKDIGFDLK